MKIIFKEDNSKKVVFGDVKIDQFFVNTSGYLCQKYCRDSYNIITNANGELNSARVDDISPNIIINRVLPEVLKIEF